ncbi:MAG: hypothetical protein ACXW1S_08820 [Acidimicrobiia bacterium]
MDTPGDPNERPTLRQALHSATGDREAEAKALAGRADDATEDDALEAVRRAHGDLGVDVSPPDHDIATPAEAEAVHEEAVEDAASVDDDVHERAGEVGSGDRRD